jgi:hypothetical protein
MKVLKLDDKVKAINICDGEERCRAKEMGDGRFLLYCYYWLHLLLMKLSEYDMI